MENLRKNNIRTAASNASVKFSRFSRESKLQTGRSPGRSFSHIDYVCEGDLRHFLPFFILIAADPVVGAGACDSRAANDEACSGLISRAGSRGEFDSRPPLYGSTPPFFPALVGRRGFN